MTEVKQINKFRSVSNTSLKHYSHMESSSEARPTSLVAIMLIANFPIGSLGLSVILSSNGPINIAQALTCNTYPGDSGCET